MPRVNLDGTLRRKHNVRQSDFGAIVRLNVPTLGEIFGFLVFKGFSNVYKKTVLLCLHRKPLVNLVDNKKPLKTMV